MKIKIKKELMINPDNRIIKENIVEYVLYIDGVEVKRSAFEVLLKIFLKDIIDEDDFSNEKIPELILNVMKKEENLVVKINNIVIFETDIFGYSKFLPTKDSQEIYDTWKHQTSRKYNNLSCKWRGKRYKIYKNILYTDKISNGKVFNFNLGVRCYNKDGNFKKQIDKIF